MSALTTRLDHGCPVVEAPYYHPLQPTQEVVLIDRLSSGRLRLGIGSGVGREPLEFARLGMALEEKSARTSEITEIVHQSRADNLVDCHLVG